MPISTVEPNQLTLQVEQRQASLELSAPHLDGYEIIQLIGEGTYGAVWKAREMATGIQVAIKRFRRQPDAQCCAEVEHLASLSAVRGIVALRKVHLHAEPYCYVMEYMPGGTLSALLENGGPRSFADSWKMFRQLIEALCYVHREGIVHGDIKPDNILLDSAGQPRLCDFGQARGRGSHGKTLGTMFYMPPEQARMEGMPDPRWDVYALGAILYESLTGEKPRFDADLWKLLTLPTRSNTETKDRLEKYARHLERRPHVDAHRHVKGVDSPAAKLIDRCLALDFDQRVADANEVLRQIDECERTRRTRPLVIFGVLAPALFLLLTGLAVLASGHWLLKDTVNQWEKSVYGGNHAIAEAIAASIQSTFDRRMKYIADTAKDPKWYSLLEEKDKDAIKKEVELLYPKEDRMVYRWSVADDQGRTLANFGRVGEGDPDANESSDPADDPAAIDANFAWRGWFNGDVDQTMNKDTPEESNLAAFRRRKGRKPFIAQPIWREGGLGWAVAGVSVPIAKSDDAEPIGVLWGSFPYDRIVRRITEFVKTQEKANREVILVNDKYQEIYSRELVQVAEDRRKWLAGNKVSKEPPKFEVKTNRAEHFEALFKAKSDTDKSNLDQSKLGRYPNPSKAGQMYLGSAKVIQFDNGQSIAVVVQQDEQTAMAPIWSLQNTVYGLGIALLALGLVFLASNTYALYRFLRQQRESAAYV